MRTASLIAAHGDALTCQPSGGRHLSTLPDGTDIAEAALVNGAARASDDAPDACRQQQAAAQEAHRGIWATAAPAAGPLAAAAPPVATAPPAMSRWSMPRLPATAPLAGLLVSARAVRAQPVRLEIEVQASNSGWCAARPGSLMWRAPSASHPTPGLSRPSPAGGITIRQMPH